MSIKKIPSRKYKAGKYKFPRTHLMNFISLINFYQPIFYDCIFIVNFFSAFLNGVSASVEVLNKTTFYKNYTLTFFKKPELLVDLLTDIATFISSNSNIQTKNMVVK